MLKAALLILRPLLPSLTCLRRRLFFALKDVNNSAFDVVCVTCHLSSSCVAANWQLLVKRDCYLYVLVATKRIT